MLPEDVWELMIDSYKYERRRCRKQYEQVFKRSSYQFIEYRENSVLNGFIGYWDFGKWVVVEHIAVKKDADVSIVLRALLQQIKLTVDENVIIVAEVDILLSPEQLAYKSAYQQAGFIENPYLYIQPSYHKGCASFPQRLMSYPHEISYEQFKDLRGLLYRFVYGKPQAV